MANTQRQYSDLDLRFQAHPVKQDLVLSVGDLAVMRSLRNLILTNHYERPFQPNVGSNVQKMLFEPVGPLTANYLQKEISDTIQNYEPRVQLDSVIVQMNPDQNSYTATITFYIQNQPNPVTINFLLERLR